VHKNRAPLSVELRDLSLSFETRGVVFEHVDLTLGSGDFAVIQGPSGGGKTSLLRVLNRLQEPSEGALLVDGIPAAELNVLELRRKIGYLQQQPVMLEGSVRRNLDLPFQYAVAKHGPKPSWDEVRRHLDAFLLSEVGLDDDAQKLSVGQQQRVALIRSLLAKPSMLLCDEPTSALDGESKRVVEEALESIHIDEGIGVVLVTHLDFEPRRVTPRRLFLRPGDGIKEVGA
jgi:putative ABC transport system ATP-binding protein